MAAAPRALATSIVGVTSSDLEPRRLTADALLDGWQAAWSGKDPTAFDAVCTLDVHYEDPLTDEPLEGPAALGAHAARLWSGFPDARLETLGPRVIDGSLASAPAKLLATHREPLEGLPATNRFVVVPVIFYCELSGPTNLRIARVRAFFDLYDAGVQLGVLPGRGTFGGKALLMLRGFGLRSGR
jgi:SnoaL-like polyketide cyclase